MGRKYERRGSLFPPGVPNVALKAGQLMQEAHTDTLRHLVGRPESSWLENSAASQIRTVYLQLCLCVHKNHDTRGPEVATQQGLIWVRWKAESGGISTLCDCIERLGLAHPKLQRVVLYHCPYYDSREAQQAQGVGAAFVGLLVIATKLGQGLLHSVASTAMMRHYEWTDAGTEGRAYLKRTKQVDSDPDRALEFEVESWDSMEVCGRHCVEEKRENFRKNLEFWKAVTGQEERRVLVKTIGEGWWRPETRRYIDI
jgi:hypothetical protein